MFFLVTLQSKDAINSFNHFILKMLNGVKSSVSLIMMSTLNSTTPQILVFTDKNSLSFKMTDVLHRHASCFHHVLWS